MQHTRSRRRLAGAVAAVTAALLAGAVATAPPASATQSPGCLGARDKVVDVTLDGSNSADYGTDGHVWALDSGSRRIRIWEVGTHQYCLLIEDVGTFVTFAGVSPNSTGTVSAGVTGSLTGTFEGFVTAEFAPVAPTSGYLGAFDAGCDQTGACTASVPGPRRLYFSQGIEHIRATVATGTYDGGTHGSWVQTLTSNTGDITG